MWVVRTLCRNLRQGLGKPGFVSRPAQRLALRATFVIGFSDWSRTVHSTIFFFFFTLSLTTLEKSLIVMTLELILSVRHDAVSFTS